MQRYECSSGSPQVSGESEGVRDEPESKSREDHENPRCLSQSGARYIFVYMLPKSFLNVWNNCELEDSRV